MESLKAENKELKNTIDSLKKEIYSQKSTIRVLEKKCEHLIIENERYRISLSELNEALFNRENEVTADEIENNTIGIELPYVAKKRSVVFGGHPTWLKAIKEMITNAKFIGNTVMFSIDLIKNAEIVWIQTNSISHSSYYKIMDAVRLYNVPCHYFRYSSPIKCVEQFIKIDEKD